VLSATAILRGMDSETNGYGDVYPVNSDDHA
jgi:hypothetical protein